MEAIIRDMMDFARGRLGDGIPVTLAGCDLKRICIDVVAEMKQAYPDRHITLETASELPAECDANRVEQMLSNLLGNAITHGADPVRVRVWDEADDVVMSVQNQGAPIPAALLPRLFEPFSQGPRDEPSRKGSDGLGLGLYIVREIARAHGGTVTASSDPGNGTTFVLRFPRDSAARQRTSSSARA